LLLIQRFILDSFHCQNDSVKNTSNKAIIDYLRPRCAFPSPPRGDAAYRQCARGGPSHGHGNMRKKFGKDRVCGSGDISSQTDRQTYSSEYFATAPAITSTGTHSDYYRTVKVKVKKDLVV